MSKDMDNKDNRLDEMTEHDQVLQYMEDLERKGLLSERELAKIERKIRAISGRQLDIYRKENQEREEYHQLMRKKARLTIAIIIFVLLGVGLELTIGRRYIFIMADDYRTVAKWIFVGLLPFVALTLYRLPTANRNSGGFLSRWVIKPFSWLVGVPFLTFAIVTTPLGYVALAGVLMPGEVVEMNAKMTHLGGVSERRGGLSCAQIGTVRVAWGSSDVCVDNRIVGDVVKVHDEVVLRGKRTAFGFYLEEIRRERPRFPN